MRHLTIFALLLSSLVARAQTTTTGSAGTCTGSMTGQVGIGVYRSGNIVSVNNTALGTVFGDAECLCDDPATDTNDLQLEILLTTLLPADANGASLELWVGNGCDNYTTRTSTATSQCEKLTTTLQTQQFITGVASTNVVIRAPISASSLATPVYRSCGGSTRARTLYLFVYKDPTMPLATCTINTNVNNTGPAAPVSAKAESGDEALTISWSPPAATDLQPAYYQLLCSTATGAIVPNKTSTEQAYSTCLSNGDYRQRTNIPIGGNSSATNSDMGSSTLPDMSFGTTSFRPLAAGDDMEPPADDLLGEPVDMAAATSDDGGTADMVTVDLLPPATGYRGVTTTSLPAPFTNLDPAFLCSPPIPSGTTSYSRRVEGLVNGTAYNFVVLAVDSYGNVTPSAVITETPAPVEDFYRRYASEGGTATGFCATNGGFGASELTMLGLLAFLLAVYHRRRLAAWWESLR